MIVSHTNLEGVVVEEVIRGIGDLSIAIDGENLLIGEQIVVVSILNISNNPSADDENITLESAEIYSQAFPIEVENRVKGWLFSKGEVIDIDLKETGPRACLTFKDLGEWGWLLMAAEWAGGRDLPC